ARGAASAVRQSLADRLQIEPDSPTRDYLDELTLDAPSASELDIERLFGLVDTNRDPLSHGAKLRDDRNQLTRWTFTGVSWGVNTDADGVVHLTVSKSAGKISVDVHSDASRTAATLEAAGEADQADPSIVLSPVTDVSGKSNGLGGEVV